MEKIVIIGNGISGITTARHIRKNSDKEIVVISAETEHFFSRTALMYVFMGHMRFEDTKPYEDWFWEKNRIDLVFDYVESIDTDSKQLNMKSNTPISYDKLVLAVGSKSNKFGWPGQNLDGVQGLYSYQDLMMLEENVKGVKKAVIVGGGLIGVEFAEMLKYKEIDVTIFDVDNKFWGNVLPTEESEMLARHIKKHHVNLSLETFLEEILDDGNGRVRGVKTKSGEIIECGLVGLCPGVSPNVEFIKSSNIIVERGVKINAYFETNIPDVYAIGDCAQFEEGVNGRKPIEQVWYTGRIMGETLAQTICGNRKAYNPGHWFNSAKFFDIEYQTYGWVFSSLRKGEADFYWEHKKGEIAIHVVWDQDSGLFKGINLFGIRMRHELFDKWLSEEASVDTVMANLATANFDPEFYRHYEKEIIQQFNNKSGRNVELNAKKWWRNLIGS